MEKYGQQWTMTDDNGKRWPTMDIDRLRLHAVGIDDTPQNEGQQRQQTMVGDDDDAQKRQ